jgi:geranylgeranyl reductase family protein
MADVIIVGAGPSGSAAAAILARAGCRVLLLDRAQFPRPKPCGDYLNPGCTSVLSRIGVWDAIAAASAPVAGMRLVAVDGTRAPTTFSAGLGCALPRAALDHVLVTHAARVGASVIEEASVVCVDREARQVRVTVARGRGKVRLEQHCASLVIGADGLSSRVARAIGAGTPLRHGRFAVGGYLEGLPPDSGDGDRRAFGELHLARDRYCGVAYFPDGRANVTIALSSRELRTWRGALEVQYWAALRAFPGLRDRVKSATLVGGLRATGPLAFCRRRAAVRGVLLAGDAAGFIDPMTGQGVYLALRGGELAANAVARALDGGGTTTRNLAGYERARRRAFGSAFLLSRLLQRIAFQPGLATRAVRRMARRPDLGTRFIDAVGNVRPAASVFHPGFLTALLGL